MCGIAGFLTDGRLPQGADRHLAAMLTEIGHRGPDGSGMSLVHERGAAMGHVRLAINGLDPSGRQPLHSADGDLVLTVSGEVYDFRRLRTLLRAQGEDIRSTSDSALVLALYRRHGLGFLPLLRGDFALALLDMTRDRLVLARDRFGVRPLYYHRDGGSIVWASEAKGVLVHPMVPRRLDRTAAVHQLMQVMVPGTSAFEGVRAVRPGTAVVVQRGIATTDTEHRYWDLDFPVADEYPTRDARDHIDVVRDAVVGALTVRTDADVPVGVHLSGGMDSGAIVGLASAHGQHPPRAFTIAFPDAAYDESPVARRVAAAHDVTVNLCTVTDDATYGDHYVRAVWHSERTFYNTLGVAKMHLSAFVRDHGVRAVLSGEGADELFAGYPAFAVDHAAESGHDASGGESDALFRGAILSDRPRSHPAFERRCGFTPAWVQPWIATWDHVRPLLDTDLRRELHDYDPLAAVAESIDENKVVGRRRLDIAQYSWVKTMLDGQILNWGGDRVDMAHAVESRPVMLDDRVAAAAVTVPPELRIRGGREKWVLREAMRGVLPNELYSRRKFAFMSPPAHRSPARAAGLTDLTNRYLTAERVREVGICDAGRVARFLDQVATVRDPVMANEIDKVCNHLLGLHILHDLFIR